MPSVRELVVPFAGLSALVAVSVYFGILGILRRNTIDLIGGFASTACFVFILGMLVWKLVALRHQLRNAPE